MNGSASAIVVETGASRQTCDKHVVDVSSRFTAVQCFVPLERASHWKPQTCIGFQPCSPRGGRRCFRGIVGAKVCDSKVPRRGGIAELHFRRFNGKPFSIISRSFCHSSCYSRCFIQGQVARRQSVETPDPCVMPHATCCENITSHMGTRCVRDSSLSCTGNSLDFEAGRVFIKSARSIACSTAVVRDRFGYECRCDVRTACPRLF